ncbi:MAG: SDR family NAD(P)-dependent oxidoreductase [Carbonactinosporaceae bacterium]
MTGRTAVVTGAANGIGEASARLLAERGANVVVVDLNGDGAAQVAASLPGPAIAVRADVADAADVEAYMSAAADAFGRVDLHHLNAGIVGPFDPLPQIRIEDFDRVVSVNLRGAFLGVRAAFRQYLRQGTGGAIVVTASIASLRGSHDLLAYQASKHGVLGVVRGAAMYGGPLGVRVNAVAPGLVPTALFASSGDAAGAGGDMEQRGRTVPLRRTGTPQEVAQVVGFLLSDHAGYVNGEMVSVDGGAAWVNSVRPAGGAGLWDPSEIDESIRARPEGP